MSTSRTGTHRTIYIVRHAKSRRAGRGVIDYERTLSKRGVKDAHALANRLLKTHTTLDQVIASSAPRGRDTASIIVDTLSIPGDRVLYDRRLYGSTLQRWLANLRKLDDRKIRHVMLVGHNPEIELLMRRLCSLSGMQTPPCGAVALSYQGSWSNLAKTAQSTPRLKWSYYPKRYFELLPEIAMTTKSILNASRAQLPRSLDWELCREILDDAVTEAVGAIYKKHHRVIENVAPNPAPPKTPARPPTSSPAKSAPAKSAGKPSTGKSRAATSAGKKASAGKSAAGAGSGGKKPAGKSAARPAKQPPPKRTSRPAPAPASKNRTESSFDKLAKSVAARSSSAGKSSPKKR